jgi:hypothetical protein
MMSKPDKDMTRKKMPILQMNIDAKVSMKN